MNICLKKSTNSLRTKNYEGYICNLLVWIFYLFLFENSNNFFITEISFPLGLLQIMVRNWILFYLSWEIRFSLLRRFYTKLNLHCLLYILWYTINIIIYSMIVIECILLIEIYKWSVFNQGTSDGALILLDKKGL
jgi:hypothetical protein